MGGIVGSVPQGEEDLHKTDVPSELIYPPLKCGWSSHAGFPAALQQHQVKVSAGRLQISGLLELPCPPDPVMLAGGQGVEWELIFLP